MATVKCFFDLLRAAAKANRIILSTPTLANIDTFVAISHGCPTCVRPPWPAYSPSVFSRTISQSSTDGSAAAATSGDVVPRKMRVGRMFAYCCSDWQIARRKSQREMWSGTSGEPTAPKKIAWWVFSTERPSGGVR